jgi:bifunctional non-homologous end joining protein LigD
MRSLILNRSNQEIMEKLTKVKFSNLDKVLFPELKLTKKDMIEYYIRVAPKILPMIQERALVRTRYPDGIYGDNFYEKDTPRGTPDWIRTFTKYSPSAKKDTNYIVCNDLDTLVWLANLAALEIHIPLSTTQNLSKPDIVLFDLDPEPPASLKEATEAAQLLRNKLETLGHKAFVKSSGKKGIHVIIPIEPIHSFKQTRNFVHNIGKSLANEHDFIVSERRQTKEPGTVLIDYPQNSERGTMIAPYSLRPLREATVSTPLEWNELITLRPTDWNIYSIFQRKKQPWKDLWEEPQRLT